MANRLLTDVGLAALIALPTLVAPLTAPRAPDAAVESARPDITVSAVLERSRAG